MNVQATPGITKSATRSASAHWADVAYAYLCGAFVLGVLAQVYLAGRGAFRGVEGYQGFGPHETMGNILGIAAVVLLVLSLVARAGKTSMIGALVLFLLTEVAQHGLAQAGRSNAWVGGLHALDGMLILLLAIGLVFEAWRRQTGDSARGSGR